MNNYVPMMIMLIAIVVMITALLHFKERDVKKRTVKRETIISNIEFDIGRINESIIESESLSLMILESRVSSAKSKLKDTIEEVNKYSNGTDAFNRGDVMLLFFTLNRMELSTLLLEKTYVDERKRRETKTLFDELNPDN